MAEDLHAEAREVHRQGEGCIRQALQPALSKDKQKAGEQISGLCRLLVPFGRSKPKIYPGSLPEFQMGGVAGAGLKPAPTSLGPAFPRNLFLTKTEFLIE